MDADSRTTAEVAAELTAALRQVGDALVRVDADALLAAEVELNRAMANLTSVPYAGDRRQALGAVRQAQAALLRCRRLGASLSTVSRAMLSASAPAPDGYTRSGDHLDRAFIHSFMRISA
jgi:hypothetical protein